MDLKTIPTWGWGAAALLVVGFAYMATRGGGQSAQSNALPATYVNSILQQLQDAANQLPKSTTDPATKGPALPKVGGPFKPGDPGTTTTIQEKSLWASSVPAILRRDFSSESAATLFKKYGVSYGTSIDLADLRRLMTKMRYNPGTSITSYDLTRIGIIKNLPTTSTTTVATSAVQSSNNGVT